MKKLIGGLLMVSAMLIGSVAMAAADTDTIQVGTVVAQPVDITATTPLSFGDLIISQSGAASITIAATPAGTQQRTNLVQSSDAQPTVGTIVLTGHKNAVVNVIVNNGVEDFTLVDPDVTGILRTSLSNAGVNSITTLDGSGSQTVYVGGTLNFATGGNSKFEGTHTMLIPVSADYN